MIQGEPSMNKLVGTGIAVSIFAGMAVLGNGMLEEERSEAVAEFSVTEVELPLMETCETTMRHNDIEFKSGVEKILGCACVARQMADSSNEADYAVAGEFIELAIKMGDDDNGDVQLGAMVAKIQTQYNLNTSQSYRMLSNVGDAVSICSAHKTYIADIDVQVAPDRDARKAEAIARLEKENPELARRIRERSAPGG